MNSIKTKSYLPSLAFVILGIIWGSNFLYMKQVVQYITPMQVVFLRVVLSVLPIVLFAIFSKSFHKNQLKYWYHFVVMSLLATVIYYFCFVKGSLLLYSGIAGALSGSAPIFSFILGAIFLAEEKITFTKVMGLLLGLLGIIILSKPFSAVITANTWQGIMFMILGSISFGASFIYAKKFITPLQIPGPALASYQMIGASVILLFITDFTGITAIFNHTKPALELIIGLSFLGTGLAFLIYYYIIDKLGGVKASSVAYIPPVIALIIGATIAGEPIGWTDFLATLIILVGVYLLRKK